VQALRPLFFGLTLMLFLIFEPRGLAHRGKLLKAAGRFGRFRTNHVQSPERR